MRRSLFVLAIWVSCLSAQEKFIQNTGFQKLANMHDDSLYAEAEKNFVAFWEKAALDIDWFKKWDKALDWQPPYAKWFETGQLNISYNCLDRHIKKGLGSKIALIFINEKGEKKNISYNDLLKQVNKIANSLKKLGVRKGDRVAIYMPMMPESIASMLACTRIGAVHVVIFGGIGAGSVKDRIIDSEAKVLLTVDGSLRGGKTIAYKSKIDPVLDECPTLQKTLVFDTHQTDVTCKEGRDFFYDLVAKNVSDECLPESLGAEDPLFILHTSGTTGKPKGILHTTGGYLVGVHATFKWVFDIKESDIYWSTADIGWITGHSFVVYGPLSNGVTQVIYEGSFDYPSKNQFAKIIDEAQVTIFYTAPTLIRMLMKWGDECLAGAKLDTLRLLGSIGEPINPNTWRWFYKYIGQERCPVVDTWFQTETGALVIAPVPGLTPLIPGTVTKALPGFQVAVLNEEGNRTKKGFLAITQPHPSMMRGVYKDHNRYILTYWSKWNGKYYFSGDVAEIDENGYIWVGGRCDEVLKVAGHRIGTAEVENALIEYPSVAEAAVVGVKDEIKGQKIIAFVVLKSHITPDVREKENLKAAVAKYLGSYVRPDEVEIVDELPKTRSGKILRRILKNLIEGEAVGSTATLYNPSCLEQLTRVCHLLEKKFYSKERAIKASNLDGFEIDQPNSFSRDLDINEISPLPLFQPLRNGEVSLSSKNIIEITTPILREHLQKANYDRIHLVEQFLDFYEQNPTTSILDALVHFRPNTSVKNYHGSSCFGLTDDLCHRLPTFLHAKKIPAILNCQMGKEGWSLYSHTALIISYVNPSAPQDRGYVLLDPNFDIENPIVLLEDGSSVIVNMKTKGLWRFYLEKDKIIAQRIDKDKSGKTVYNIQEYINSEAVAVKPMIASDRNIPLVSRNEKGEHVAHINIKLDSEEVTWALGYEKQSPISFKEFMSGERRFDDSFASKMSFTSCELNELVLKIIKNKSILDELRLEYLNVLETSSRKDEFYGAHKETL